MEPLPPQLRGGSGSSLPSTTSMVKEGMFTKRASAAADLNKAANIMRAVYEEDPSYWPYGLDANQFDGGLYLISKSASADPVGFVGWQVRNEAGRDVGYYSIGVLPEHRHQGFAKAAVNKLLAEKSASVDIVRAMVCSHNGPSKQLARAVGVTIIEKMAAIKEATAPPIPASLKKQLLHTLAGAVGSTAFFDQTADPSREISSTLRPWEWDKQRMLMGGMNAALGGMGGALIADKHVGKGLLAFTSAPAKDLMLKGQETLYKMDEAAEASSKALSSPRPQISEEITKVIKSAPKSALLGALGIGVGGLGIAAYVAKKKLDLLREQGEASRAGRVKVTLPTKNPGDSETMLDLPMEDVQLSQALRSRLGRDTRRRLYAETRERTARRKPINPRNPTEKEKEDQMLEEEEVDLSKEAGIVSMLSELHPLWFPKQAASQAAPAGAVPTPPPQGVNPATRMTQQQVAANAMQPSTDANPQIMKAQQEAAAAQQQGQQQAAQVEQQAAQQAAQLQQEAAQAQMEQQQKFSEQLSKAKQENEVLQMKLEKSKVEAELVSAKAKAVTELKSHQDKMSGAASGKEQSAVQRLTQARLDRIQKKLSKSAATAGTPYEQQQRDQASRYGPPARAHPAGIPGTPQANDGLPTPQETMRLQPGAAQKMNDRGHELVAKGMINPMSNYRVSYGKVGDWLFENFGRSRLTTPTQPALTSGLTHAQAINNPDRMGMIMSELGRTREFMNYPQLR